MNALEHLKQLLTLDRKTLPIKDIAPLVSEIEKMYLQAADKLGKKRSRENELASDLAKSKKLAAALAVRLGYKHLTEEDRKRIMGKDLK